MILVYLRHILNSTASLPCTASSQGELSCDGHQIRVFDFLTQKSTKHTGHSNAPGQYAMGGHGSADYHLTDAFISAVAVSAHIYVMYGFS